jgi:hypothetical protein
LWEYGYPQKLLQRDTITGYSSLKVEKSLKKTKTRSISTELLTDIATHILNKVTEYYNHAPVAISILHKLHCIDFATDILMVTI